MNYYLPLEYVNDYWEHMDQLVKLKLYMNRFSFSNLVIEFYDEFFDMVEEKKALPWAFDYVEYKSEKLFKHVAFDWFDHGESIHCKYLFSEEAMDFITYEFFLDPLSNNTTANLIQNELDDECFIEILHYTHVEIRNEQFRYGDNFEFQSPYLLFVSLVNVVEDMKKVDETIISRMFNYKRIKTFYNRFRTDEYIYKTKLNHSFYRDGFFY